jgi:signal transduction histidine kinase
MAHQLRRRIHWLNTSPLRAGGEAVIFGAGLLVITWIARHHITAGERQNALFIAVLTTVCWHAIRLRQGRGMWWQRISFEIGCGLLMALVAGALIEISGVNILAGISSPVDEPGLFAITGSIWRMMEIAIIQGKSIPTREDIPYLTSPSVPVTMVASSIVAVIVSRCMMLGWRIWTQLRQRHLVWALTHSHIMLVVLGLFLVAAGLTINSLFYLISANEDSNIVFSVILNLMPLIIIMVFLTLVLLIFVLPPALALSYIAARHTTRRLQPLTEATTRLRQGDYSVRVPVQGADEVAVLQTDFNVMAEALERAIHDVQTERDHVAKLLRERRELVASVSHELRTPVAVLYSYLEPMVARWENRLPEEVKRDIVLMENETKQLQRLLEDLFTLSRAEVGELAIRCQPVELQTMIPHAVAAVAPVLWQTAKVELVVDLPPALPPARVDEMRLEQIVHNLLRNSVRHTPPGGIIAITAAINGDQIIVRVQDTGEGIAPEHLPHIWERFYRVDSSRDHSGAGLGLALVKELTEAMGGQVEVSSAPDLGSTFSIILPRA